MNEESNSVAAPSAKGIVPGSAADAYFSAWAGQFSIPCLVLTLDQRIVWANPSAMELVDRTDEFNVANGVFACTDKVQAIEFKAFIATVKALDTWVCRLSEDRHIIFRGEAVLPEGLAPGVALMLIEAQSERRYLWADLIKAFGLTRTEAVIARRMVDGSGAVEIAEALSVSIETVRTHIRRLYAKLSVNNREKMFAVISCFRIF
jgi:DNA-binding CsgD family transcriptional regulator